MVKNEQKNKMKNYFIFLHFLIFIVRMSQNNLLHPREKLPQPAIQVLYTKSEVNFQSGRFFIHEIDFESRIVSINHQFWRIQAFAVFVRENHKKIINSGCIHGDLILYSGFFNMFLSKEFADPKGMFRKIFRQFLFESLLMFDLFREKCQ